MDHLSSRLLARDIVTGSTAGAEETDKTRINWVESIGVSVVFIALMLSLSCWWFSTRDY